MCILHYSQLQSLNQYPLNNEKRIHYVLISFDRYNYQIRAITVCGFSYQSFLLLNFQMGGSHSLFILSKKRDKDITAHLEIRIVALLTIAIDKHIYSWNLNPYGPIWPSTPIWLHVCTLTEGTNHGSTDSMDLLVKRNGMQSHNVRNQSLKQSLEKP